MTAAEELEDAVVELLAALRLIGRSFAGWENSEGEEIGSRVDNSIRFAKLALRRARRLRKAAP